MPGKEAEIVVEVTIDRRYHIQSAITPKPYIAAALTAKPVEGIVFGVVKYPVAHDVKAPAGLEGTLSVYEGKIYLLMPVKVGAEAKAGAGEIELGLLTQACDDKNCLPPKTLVLKVPYRIGTAGDAQAARDEKLDAAAEAQAYARICPASAGASGCDGAGGGCGERGWGRRRGGFRGFGGGPFVVL